MKDFKYLLDNFFTHKDYLVPAEQIPGTIYTPLHFIVEAAFLLFIFCAALYVSRRKDSIRPIFANLWKTLMVWEIVIIVWDNVAGHQQSFDFANSLSLYPCSIFLYTLPLLIWGGPLARKIGAGYVCTLGMLGAVVNFIWPLSRLTTYSIISFAGFHTFFFHGSIFFVFLVLMFSGLHRYTRVTHLWELFTPCVASLLVSIPANLINYSPIDADYMYFKGRFFVLADLFAGIPEKQITMILYGLYIIVPALFYMPSYLCFLLRNSQQTDFTLYQLLRKSKIENETASSYEYVRSRR